MRRGDNKAEADTGERPHTAWAEPRTGELRVGGHKLFCSHPQHPCQSCRRVTLARPQPPSRGRGCGVPSGTAGAQPTTRLGRAAPAAAEAVRDEHLRQPRAVREGHRAGGQGLDTESCNHRMGLEGTSRDHPVQPSATARPPGASDTGTRPAGVGMIPERDTPRPPRTGGSRGDIPARLEGRSSAGAV